MADDQQAIEALANEQRIFAPSPQFVANSNAVDRSLYEEAAKDHEGTSA
jgi:hypothetical protein